MAPGRSHFDDTSPVPGVSCLDNSPVLGVSCFDDTSSVGRVQFWHQSSTGSVLFDDTSPVLGVSCFDDTSPESIGTHPLTCLWITSQVFCYESQLSHVGGPRCTVRTISSSCAAGLGALYGPLVLHVLLASVHCTVVNAFRIIVTSNPFRLG